MLIHFLLVHNLTFGRKQVLDLRPEKSDSFLESYGLGIVVLNMAEMMWSLLVSAFNPIFSFFFRGYLPHGNLDSELVSVDRFFSRLVKLSRRFLTYGTQVYVCRKLYSLKAFEPIWLTAIHRMPKRERATNKNTRAASLFSDFRITIC